MVTLPRLSHFIAATLVLALPLSAQQPGASSTTSSTNGSLAAAMPTSGLRAELIKDVDELQGKFLGLAKAMSGKYGWRPATGVRSVGEVYMHIVGDNYAIPVMLGIKAPASFPAADMKQAFASAEALEKVTDEAKVQESLAQSFAHVKQAIASVPDDQLDAPINMFGQPATKRELLVLLVTHLHEHLGQSIAYARSNSVVPPWSVRGGE
jgi:uncharacterized damage-inducible protein DinB